jgi:trimethylamine---corrinoid protein Co-methyltransferase
MKRNLHAGRQRRDGVQFRVLTDDDVADIHLGTLEVLERTGVFVEDEEAREVFAGAGAEVDAATGVVRIPAHVVEQAVRTAPSKVVLAGRHPRNDIVLEAGRVGFTNFGEGVQIVDPHSGELRAPTKRDVGDTARVVDALPNVDVYERAIAAMDVPQASAPLHQAEAWMTNTSKHGFMGSGDGYLSAKLLEMAAAVAGGRDKLRARPIISFITCPVSPLKLVRDTCEIIMAAARGHVAVNILSMAMAGGSSPVTLAGTLVTHNAEVLAGLTLNQLTRPGAAVIYGSSTTAMDLRLAAASVGSPECALINAAVAQIARFYLLPSWVAGA